MGENMLPHARVIILVESFEGTEVFEVPLASSPIKSMTPAINLETNRWHNEDRFEFGCYALYDINQNLTYKQEIQPGTDMDTMILRMARDILKKREEEGTAVEHRDIR